MGNTWRQCSIDITNECSTYYFGNPCVYMESGVCTEPLPPLINSNSTGSALFTKTGHTARGAVGVFTYELIKKSTKNTSWKIAVMFSVPYDYDLYFNLYAVGIFDESQACNKDLYQLMYYESNDKFVRGKATGPSLTHTDGQVTIMATMSDSTKSVMKVVVKDN
ncbi:DELTA-sagatoxin-Srs1a-like isoform X2 [Sander lucioperca]|uniref:DELTA-sagatoxin-Srs1a-like n=1 Tax=Sander lucioperca TaxID=283035 RepID=A0A8C9ZGG9_SANLU|nr:DELTA-sagatoxin-Srs1a-like isoform X2 [Sander lucioperca]